MIIYLCRFCGLAVGLTILVVSSLGQDIHGRVSTSNGKPVAGVVVQPSGMIISTITDENGHFVLDDKRFHYFRSPLRRKLIFVNARGYEVSTMILETDQNNVDIRLQPTSSEPITIPTCVRPVDKGFAAVGQFLRIIYSKKLKIRNTSNFEYSGFTLTIKEKSGEAVLHGWNGVYPTTYPTDELLLSSNVFEVKRNSIGLDWKGRTTDGRYWRHIGGAVGMIDTFTYETGSESAAREFDAILGEICIQK